MRAFQISHFAQEAVVKHLRTHLAIEGDQIKEYKEAIYLLNGEVITQKAKVTQLEGIAYLVEELTKANTNLTIELTAFHEQVDKVKVDAIQEFKDSQPYFDELGGQYDEGFEDFCKQAVFLFPSLDFSQIHIDTIVPMSLGGGDVIIEIDDDGADERVEAEKAGPAEGETDERTTTEGPTVPNTPPT